MRNGKLPVRRAAVGGVVAILGLAAAAGGCWIGHSKPDSPKTARVYEVRLTAEGFRPGILRVNPGEEIRFVSELGEPFWPASDSHPTHETYPEFDPKRQLGPGDAWIFSPGRPGLWDYHDHLRPEFSGRIVVNEFSGAQPNCPPNSNEPHCWRKDLEDKLRSEVRTRGLAAAFASLTAEYEANPDWQSSCHAMAHAIGAEAYDLYAAGRNLALDDDRIALCSYGFYHGFMERLLNQTGDPAAAKKFCEDERLGTGQTVTTNCYHGIGHALANNHDPATWDDPKKMLLPALALCDGITPDPRIATDCYNGAFAGINEFFSTGKYNLPVPTKPFEFCRSLEPKYHAECYVAANIPVMFLVNNDFARALAMAEQLPNLDSVAAYMRSLIAPVAGGLNTSEFKERYVGWVEDCRALREEWRDPCLKGLFGYIGLGLSEYAYPGGAEICSSPRLDEAGRDDCFKYLLRNGGNRLKFPAQFKAVCERVPAEFRSYCDKSW